MTCIAFDFGLAPPRRGYITKYLHSYARDCTSVQLDTIT